MSLRALLKQGWLEILSQTLLLVMLLIPALGLLYPLSLVWPTVLNRFWHHRDLLLLQLLPFLLAAFSLHLLGSWRWLLLHHGQSRVFREFALGRHLLWLGLGSLAAGAAALLPLPWNLATFALALSAACLLPAVTRGEVRDPGGPSALLLSMGAAGLTAAGLACLPGQRLLGLGLLLLSFVLLPWLARRLPAPGPGSRRPWLLMAVVALAGTLVMGSCYMRLREQLRARQADLLRAEAAAATALRLERPWLREPGLAGNGFDTYWSLVGDSCGLGGKQNPFGFPLPDSERVRTMFDLETGIMVPDAELLQRYAPQLDTLQRASRHRLMQYPFRDYLRQCGYDLPAPKTGSLQDLALLLSARGIASCNAGDCARGARQLLDAERVLQDLSIYGQVLQMMVAYKSERIVVSTFGTRIRPGDLSGPQWRALLLEWRRLLAAEQGLFPQVLGHEMLVAALILLDSVPDGLEAVPLDPVSLVVQLAMLPLIEPGIADLLALSAQSHAYLAQPVHDMERLQQVTDSQKALARGNAHANTVLIDVVLAMQRFREHQVLLRGFYQHLALQAYHQAEGRYPERLAQLVPAWLPELPADPYTGQPFVYRRSGDDFLLYSQGENQHDDGGDGFYGNFLRSATCSGQELAFANLPPERCRQ